MSERPSQFKFLIGKVLCRVLRLLEILLGPHSLREFLKPLAQFQARRDPVVPLIENGLRASFLSDLSPEALHRACVGARVRHQLSRVVPFWPDRLRAPRWRSRCEVVGLEHLEAAFADGQSVVLGFVHFGPMFLLRYLLRAQGVPTTSMVNSRPDTRGLMPPYKDRLCGLTKVPHVVHSNDLKEARKLLKSPGRCLAMTADTDVKRAARVQIGGRDFEFSTGSARMAKGTGAAFIPAILVEVAPWRYEIHLGPAADPGLSQEEMLAQLARHIEPLVLRHPEQCGPELLSCLRQ